MNSQVLYNIQQADEIRKLKEERDQLLKIHDKVCNQAAELLKALNDIVNTMEKDMPYIVPDGTAGKVIKTARAAIQNATR